MFDSVSQLESTAQGAFGPLCYQALTAGSSADRQGFCRAAAHQSIAARVVGRD